MTEERIAFEHWISHQPLALEPGLEAAMRAALDAYDAAAEKGVLTAAQLRILVDAAGDKRAQVWPSAAQYLSLLSGRFPTIGEAIEEMARSSRWDVRFHALFCLGPTTPPEVADPVLRASLGDRAWKVRWRAALLIDALGKRDLLPDLAAALAVETHETTRTEMERHLLLLRDGAIVTELPNGSRELQVRAEGATVIRDASAAECKDKGLDALIAELRDLATRP